MKTTLNAKGHLEWQQSASTEMVPILVPCEYTFSLKELLIECFPFSKSVLTTACSNLLARKDSDKFKQGVFSDLEAISELALINTKLDVDALYFQGMNVSMLVEKCNKLSIEISQASNVFTPQDIFIVGTNGLSAHELHVCLGERTPYLSALFVDIWLKTRKTDKNFIKEEKAVQAAKETLEEAKLELATCSDAVFVAAQLNKKQIVLDSANARLNALSPEMTVLANKPISQAYAMI